MILRQVKPGSCILMILNEFKFACPVCGQHIMCDASLSGSVMECPTCFQKIIARQVPAANHKFILAGARFSGKRAFSPRRGTFGGTQKQLHKQYQNALNCVLNVVNHFYKAASYAAVCCSFKANRARLQ